MSKQQITYHEAKEQGLIPYLEGLKNLYMFIFEVNTKEEVDKFIKKYYNKDNYLDFDSKEINILYDYIKYKAEGN